MNYLEIFNKVMLELNYRPINVFSNIFKNEHLRILENIKRVNSEICSSFDWDFLLKKEQVQIERVKSCGEGADSTPAATSIAPCGLFAVGFEPKGKVVSLFEEGQKLRYHAKFEDFLKGSAPPGTYGNYGGKLILGANSAHSPRSLDVYYSSNCYAKTAEDTEIDNFENATDVSIIPAPFCEEALVYGTCVKTKANPGFVKFPFWVSQYTRAIARLRSENPLTYDDTPNLVIKTRSG